MNPLSSTTRETRWNDVLTILSRQQFHSGNSICLSEGGVRIRITWPGLSAAPDLHIVHIGDSTSPPDLVQGLAVGIVQSGNVIATGRTDHVGIVPLQFAGQDLHFRFVTEVRDDLDRAILQRLESAEDDVVEQELDVGSQTEFDFHGIHTPTAAHPRQFRFRPTSLLGAAATTSAASIRDELGQYDFGLSRDEIEFLVSLAVQSIDAMPYRMALLQISDGAGEVVHQALIPLFYDVQTQQFSARIGTDRLGWPEVPPGSNRVSLVPIEPTKIAELRRPERTEQTRAMLQLARTIPDIRFDPIFKEEFNRLAKGLDYEEAILT